MKSAKQLARDHAEYTQLIYELAFLHGYKHGKEK